MVENQEPNLKMFILRPSPIEGEEQEFCQVFGSETEWKDFPSIRVEEHNPLLMMGRYVKNLGFDVWFVDTEYNGLVEDFSLSQYSNVGIHGRRFAERSVLTMITRDREFSLLHNATRGNILEEEVERADLDTSFSQWLMGLNFESMARIKEGFAEEQRDDVSRYLRKYAEAATYRERSRKYHNVDNAYEPYIIEGHAKRIIDRVLTKRGEWGI